MAIIDRQAGDRAGVIYNPCGRCAGSGQLPFWNDSTGRSEMTWCGICGGTGQDIRMETIGAPVSNLGQVGRRSFADGIQVTKASGGRRRK